MMRDPIWFKEFEREYNEREDRIAELKEKYNKWKHEEFRKELGTIKIAKILKEKEKDGMD